MNKHIHIVCPEIPYPFSSADMTDTYFQLQLLHEAGYTVILHCFHEDTSPDTKHLENLSDQIYLYERNLGHKAVSIRHPYCIASRSNASLLENLLRQHYPVLFQGTAVTFFLPELAANGYKTFVRINGIASALYEANISCQKSILKKAYSFNEARLIRKWEEKIAEHATIITTSACDQKKFQQLYKDADIKQLSPCIPMPEINTQPGTGMYCLYYGDLSNPENENMVYWLSENVFRNLPVPFIVADTRNTPKTQDTPQHQQSNICMVCNPAEAELNELIQKAQIILLPRCHKTGFDKRLLNALAKGRHCICNDEMIDGTGLENLFIIANGSDEIANTIERYFSRSFTARDVCDRTEWLAKDYAKQSLAKLLEIVEV